MAFDEEEIVRTILEKFEERLHRIRTKADFENFLNNLTKVKVKNFLKAALEDYAVQREQGLTSESATIANIRAIKDYIDSL